MAPGDAPARRSVRWWSWWLVAHAAVIAAVLVDYGLTTGSDSRPAVPDLVLTLTALFSLLLSTPWWMVVGGLWFIPVNDDDTALIAVLGWVTQALPLLINLAIHAVVLNLVRRRRAGRLAPGPTSAAGVLGRPSTGAPPGVLSTRPGDSADIDSAQRRPTGGRRRGRALALSAVAGALTWLAWLGWDRTASFDTVTGTVQDPYVTLQVLGCAACVAVLVAVLAATGRPLEGAGGVALGFWVAWTADAVSQDESGLAGVGAMMLLFGLALGAAIAAALGWGLRLLVAAARQRRADTASGRASPTSSEQART